MLEVLVVLLILLWLTGNLHINGLTIPDFALFTINRQVISLWDVLIFILVLWAIGILPSPFRQIAGVLLVLWVLSVLGILAFAGLSNLLVIAIIVGIVVSIVQRR